MTSCRHCGREGRGYADEPTGYLQWFHWADRKSLTHHQEPCPGCGRLTVWRPGRQARLECDRCRADVPGVARLEAECRCGGQIVAVPLEEPCPAPA